MTCPACGNDERARVEPRKEEFHEPDVHGEFKYEITVCDACGEEVLSFEQAQTYERAYAAAVARARGAMTADRILALRMDLGKSQPYMEAAFGVGPKTWGRWERGEIAPPGPATRLMWLAENRPEVFAQLVDANTLKPVRHAKLVGSIEPQFPGEGAVGYRISKTVASRAGKAMNTGGTVGNGGSSGTEGGAV